MKGGYMITVYNKKKGTWHKDGVLQECPHRNDYTCSGWCPKFYVYNDSSGNPDEIQIRCGNINYNYTITAHN